MIYTIGYQAITPERLAEFVEALDAVLIDCRYKPFSRKPGFGGRQLAQRFGDRYRASGHELGGAGHVTREGLDRLASIKGNALLLCLEEGPADCHRHHAI